MALTTYSELLAAINSRTHRGDLTASIPDYVTIAEKRLNRELGLSAQETEASLTATIGSRFITPPSGFGTPIALFCTTYLPRIELNYRLLPEMPVSSSNGPSDYWTVDGVLISTDAPADQAYTYTLRYLAKFTIATSLTNYLLTNYPDLYLYGALIEAANDTKDNALLERSERRYAQALQECKDGENRNKSLAPLRTEFFHTGRSNIISGT